MKTIPDGRGVRRVWYEFDEIEQIAADTLVAADLWPSTPGRIDVESLVETYQGASTDYFADLEDSILGYTLFRTPPHVVVSRALSDLALADGASLGLRGRWRATIAHEAAHIALHSRLYAAGSRTPGQPAIRCMRAELEAGEEARDWREVQANMGMAAFLMPRALFVADAIATLDVTGPAFLPLAPTSPEARGLTDYLSGLFEASHQAVTYRLQTFGFLPDPRQRRGGKR